jgi:hypothetical protein
VAPSAIRTTACSASSLPYLAALEHHLAGAPPRWSFLHLSHAGAVPESPAHLQPRQSSRAFLSPLGTSRRSELEAARSAAPGRRRRIHGWRRHHISHGPQQVQDNGRSPAAAGSRFGASPMVALSLCLCLSDCPGAAIGASTDGAATSWENGTEASSHDSRGNGRVVVCRLNRGVFAKTDDID